MSGRTPNIILELRNRYQAMDVKPFGECLVVPLKELPKFQEQHLKKLGYKVIYQEHDGYLCGLVVLTKETLDTKPENEMQEAPTSPTEKPEEEKNMRWRIWSVEEAQKLESLSAKDTPVSELADLFHRSPSSIRHKLDALRARHALEGKPEEAASSDDRANIQDRKCPTKATPTTISPIEELLDAARALLPNHKRGAVTILKEALFLLAEGESHEEN